MRRLSFCAPIAVEPLNNKTASAAPSKACFILVSSSPLFLQQKFLDTPIRRFRGIYLSLRRTSQRVRTRELAEIASRFPNYAQHLSIQRDFENAPRIRGLADKQHLGRTLCDAERIGRPDHSGQTGTGRCRSVHRPRARIGRYIDGELAQELAFGVEDLNAPIGAVADINIVVAVDGDRMRQVELTRAIALCPPLLHPIAVLVELGDARVDVAIRNVDVAF